MAEKSHVSMGQQVCIVTGQTFDSGELLLDKGLRNTLERNTVTGWGVSPEVQERLDNGFIAMVGIESDKSERLENGNITPEGAYRTGEIVYLKKEVCIDIFDQAPEGGISFVDQEVMQYLHGLYTESQEEE